MLMAILLCTTKERGARVAGPVEKELAYAGRWWTLKEFRQRKVGRNVSGVCEPV